MTTKALVAGWFSFVDGHATGGDILSCEVACAWLQQAGIAYDVAFDPPFSGGVNWRTADPAEYAYVVFVCGPFAQGELEAQFLARFGRSRLIGLNLSMQVPLAQWSPFDFLIERDSSEGAHPDMVFMSRRPLVPVVGVCRVESYDGGLVDEANRAIDRLLAGRELSLVEIDTRLDTNSTGLRTPAEIEALIARVDVLVTTRLHGMVMALKNGVPVVAIDPEAGGAKIVRQAGTIGWPAVFAVDSLDDAALQAALRYCLTEEARQQARDSYARALSLLDNARDRFHNVLQQPDSLAQAYRRRQAAPAWPPPAPATPARPPAAPERLSTAVRQLRSGVRQQIMGVVRRVSRRP